MSEGSIRQVRLYKAEGLRHALGGPRNPFEHDVSADLFSYKAP